MSTHITIAKKGSGHNLRVSVTNPGAPEPSEYILEDHQHVEVLVYGDGVILMQEIAKVAPPAVALPDIEVVSDQVHRAWIESKLIQGVTSRKSESGEELMVPYAALSEAAKELDRATVRAVYAAIERSAA